MLDFVGQVTEDDLLLTRLPDKVKKPKWAKPRKPHGKASARSYTGVEAAELAVDKAEHNSNAAGKQLARQDTPENGSDEDIIVPATPPRAYESQGGTTIILAVRTPERLRPGPDLRPTIITSPETDPSWQLAASTAPPRLRQDEGRLKRKRVITNRYREAREDGEIQSIGLSQSQHHG